MRGQHRSEKGFSLLEVVVAMGVLALLVLAVYTVISSSAVARKKAELRQQALYLAQGIMEFALDKGVAEGENGPDDLSASIRDLFDTMDRDEHFEVDVQIDEYEEMDTLYSVTIAVQWPEDYFGGGRVELWSLAGVNP